MVEPTGDHGKKLVSLANRLRVLHAELADQPADMRSEQLRDEVQRTVGGLAPGAREPFLTELVRQFPIWSADGVVSGATAAPAPKAAAPEPKDPKSLAERLIEACRGLGDADRQAIAARLSAGGLVLKQGVPAAAPVAAPAGAPVTASGAAEFRKHVGMAADAPVDSSRLADVAAMLAEFTLRLEPWACNFWKDIAPDAKNTVYPTLNKDLGRYMLGDDKLPKEALAKSVYRLRSLVSLLLKGMSEAGRSFSKDHMGRYSVEAIEKAAGPGGLMTAKEVLCWRQYVRQMEGVDGAAIEKRLKSLMAKDVDASLSQVL